MITTLDVLLFCLKVILALSVLAILLLGADYLWYEYSQWKRTTETARHRADKELSAVEKVRQDAVENLLKTRRREQKEAEAAKSFFMEDYFRGFDENGALIYRGATAPSDADWEFYKAVDNVADATIFTTTEEL